MFWFLEQSQNLGLALPLNFGEKQGQHEKKSMCPTFNSDEQKG